MSEKLLQKVADNYQTAVILHSELSSVMLFIGLTGYHLLHEYHTIAELAELRRVKKYIVETFGAYTSDQIPESANLAAPLIGGKNRRKLTQDETVQILKDGFEAYVSWEQKTLRLYSGVARELLDAPDVASFNFVSRIIDDVKKELDHVINMVVQLESHDWDMSQIVAEQFELCEEYRERLNRLRIGDLLCEK